MKIELINENTNNNNDVTTIVRIKYTLSEGETRATITPEQLREAVAAVVDIPIDIRMALGLDQQPLSLYNVIKYDLETNHNNKILSDITNSALNPMPPAENEENDDGPIIIFFERLISLAAALVISSLSIVTLYAFYKTYNDLDKEALYEANVFKPGNPLNALISFFNSIVVVFYTVFDYVFAKTFFEAGYEGKSLEDIYESEYELASNAASLASSAFSATTWFFGKVAKGLAGLLAGAAMIFSGYGIYRSIREGILADQSIESPHMRYPLTLIFDLPVAVIMSVLKNFLGRPYALLTSEASFSETFFPQNDEDTIDENHKEQPYYRNTVEAAALLLGATALGVTVLAVGSLLTATGVGAPFGLPMIASAFSSFATLVSSSGYLAYFYAAPLVVYPVVAAILGSMVSWVTAPVTPDDGGVTPADVAAALGAGVAVENHKPDLKANATQKPGIIDQVVTAIFGGGSSEPAQGTDAGGQGIGYESDDDAAPEAREIAPGTIVEAIQKGQGGGAGVDGPGPAATQAPNTTRYTAAVTAALAATPVPPTFTDYSSEQGSRPGTPGNGK